MKKLTLIVLLGVFCGISPSEAQFFFLLGRWNGPFMSSVDSTIAEQDTKPWKALDTNQIPVTLDNIIKRHFGEDGLTGETYLSHRIAGFLFEPGYYWDWGDTMAMNAATAYGALGYGNHLGRVLGNKDARKELLEYSAIKENRKEILTVIKYPVHLAFWAMDHQVQNMYLQMLKETIEYVKADNYASETTYLNVCRQKKESGRTLEWKFGSYDSNGKEDPFRKAKIFWYRRESEFRGGKSTGVSQKDAISFLTQIVEIVKKWEKKSWNTWPAGNYPGKKVISELTAKPNKIWFE